MESKLKYILTFFLAFSLINSFGQNLDKRTVSPKKASILSAVVPGLGQIYNKKYWKVPIVYACLGATIYYSIENQSNFNTYAEALKLRSNGGDDIYKDIYTDNQLVTISEFYQRNRDLSYILTGVVYILNIVDASVDAHLFEFNVDDNLSFSTQPNILATTQGVYPSLLLKLNF